MKIEYVLNGLADQRNIALDELVQVRAQLREAQERITELEAQLPKPDGAPDAGQPPPQG